MRAEHDTELGKGVLELRAILSRVKNIDDKFVFVEQESYASTPLESVKRDYEYISKLSF